MLHKNTLFGIIAAIVYAQSALGVASMQTASDTNQGGQASILSRAGSLRTSTTRTISTGPKASVSGTNETNSARLTSSAGGINAVGTKANKLTKSTAATGAALTELERRIDDLSATKADESYVKNYVDVYDRETVDSKLAGKIDRGTDFEQAFDARFGTKSIPSVTAVSNLDTRLATAEDKINTIEHNPGTDESTVNSLINSAVQTKKLVNEDYVSSAVASAKTGAVNDAKTYADDTFATKTALNNYDTSAQTTAKIQAATEGLATTGYVTEQIGKIEIPEEANLSEYYKAQHVDALLANKLNNNALDNYDTSAETSGKIQTAIAGLASQTYASEQASNALTSAKDYADSKITGLASQTYASEQASAALEAAKDYADSKITGTGEVDLSDYYKKTQTYSQAEVNSAIANATETAKDYADGKIVGLASQTYASEQASNALTSAKDYADQKFAAVPATDLSDYYNKTQVEALIDSVNSGEVDLTGYYNKTEADDKFATKVENAANLETAKAYADTKVAGLSTQTYANEQASSALETAKAYADTKVAGLASQDYANEKATAALEAAKAYADEIIAIDDPVDLSDYYKKSETYNKAETTALVENNLGIAKDYTDSKIVGFATENFAIEKAAAAYDSAKDYADENFAPKSALSAKADASTVNALTERVGSAESDISALQSSLDGKADKTTVNTLTSRINSAESNIETLQSDLENVYTKGEVDTKLTGLSSGVGEEQVQQMINSAVASEVGNNYYTKTAADAKFATITTTNSLSSALSDKANASSVYTKTEVDTKLSGKLNSNALNDYSTTTQMNSAINSAVANLASKSDVQELERTVTSGLAARPTTEQTLAMVNGAQLCGGTIRAEETDQGSSTRITVYCDD